MLNKIKNIFNKKVLSFGLFLILSIVGAIGFSFSKNKTESNVNIVQAEAEVKAPEIVEQDFLTLKVVNDEQPKVSKTANNADNGNWGSTSGTINGGSEIKITAGSATVLGQTFSPNNGYKHTGFAIYSSSTADESKLVFRIEFKNPAEENGYTKLELDVQKFSEDEKCTFNVDTITDEENKKKIDIFTCTPEDIISTGYSDSNNQIFIKALTATIPYKLDLYYQASNTATTYSSKQVEYDIETEIDLTTDGTTDDGITDFGYWVLKSDLLIPTEEDSVDKYTSKAKSSTEINNDTGYEYYYDKNNNSRYDQNTDYLVIIPQGDIKTSSTKIITIYSGNSDAYTNPVEKYKFIANEVINNNKIKVKSFNANKDCYGNFTQNTTNPLIAAKISRTYDATISNHDSTQSCWAANAYTTDTTIKHQLIGAYSSDELSGITNDGLANDNWEKPYKTKVQIKDHSDYAYKFMDSEKDANNGYSFYKKDNFFNGTDLNDEAESATNGKYVVFNYGYKITGWTATYRRKTGEDTATKNIGFTWNEAEMQDIALFVDEVFAGEAYSADNIVITFTPQWEAVNIKMLDTENSNAEVSSTTYNGDYLLSRGNLVSKPGKSIINYITTSGNVIVGDDSYRYNYIYIPKGDYKYNAGQYTLNVTPEYVDNMYKIMLLNVGETDSLAAYDVDSNKYTEGSASYHNNWYDYSNYDESASGVYSFVKFNLDSDKFIETYITNTFDVLKATYEDGINSSNGGTDFAILNKVYGLSSGEGVAGNNEYIYLTNEHAYAMPLFTRDYYDLIFFTNTNAETSDNKFEYNYKTSEYNAGTAIEKEDYDAVLTDVSGIAFGTTYTYETGTKINNEEEHVDGSAYFAYNPNWNFAEGGDTGNFAISAQWFRKYYNLDIYTLFNGTESFHGYVKVDINDMIDNTSGNKSGNYVVLFYEGEMKIYKLTAKDPNNDIFDNTKVTKFTLNALFNNAGENTDNRNNNQDVLDDFNSAEILEDYIKLYAGCDIIISAVDQSKDNLAALNDDNFLDMVGYKYVSMICDENNPAGDDIINQSNYEFNATAADVEEWEFTSGKVLRINVTFEQIKYLLNLEIDNKKAGDFVLKNNITGAETTSKFEYKLPASGETLVIGDSFRITYRANAGYELQNNAYTLTKSGSAEISVLKTGKLEQVYQLLFNSEWLRNYYYAIFDDSFLVDDVLDGSDPILQLNINTNVISFDVGVKLYDIGLDPSDPNFVKTYYVYRNGDNFLLLDPEDSEAETYTNPEDGLTYTIYKYSLNSSTGEANLAFNIGNFLKEYDGKDFYILDIASKEYVLLNSRLYNPKKPENQLENDYRSYDFLLKTKPNNTINLTSNKILQMIAGVSVNTIIPDNERELFIMLQSSELTFLTVSIEEDKLKNDRKVIISNGTNNSVEFINLNGKTMYSYMGAKNNLSANFDSKYYSDVEFYLDGLEYQNKLTTNSFTTEKTSHTLSVKYIENTLSATIEYYSQNLEGEVNLVSEAELSTFVTGSKLIATNGVSGVELNKLYVGNELEYSYTWLNLDYDIELTLNNLPPKILSSTTYNKTVNSADYAYGEIKIIIKFVEKNKEQISVWFALNDSNKVMAADTYGSIEVYENDNLQPDEETATNNGMQTSIVIGREVYLNLLIAEGYKYVGFKYNTNDVNTTYELGTMPDGTTIASGLENKNILFITDNYTLEDNAGSYIIYVEKINIQAKLAVNSENKVYSISSDDLVTNNDAAKTLYTINGLYASKVINFHHEETDREVLNHFYYTDKAGNKVAVTDDELNNGLQLTSDVIANLPKENEEYVITFGMELDVKHKLNYNISGVEYVDTLLVTLPDSSTTTLAGYTGYYKEGAEIQFNITTLETGKYDIVVSKNSVVDGDSAYSLTKTYELEDEDLTINIIIAPHAFNLVVDENIYTNLVDLINSNPTDADAGTYSNISYIGQKYDEIAEIRLNITKSASGKKVAELQTVTLSGNGLGDVVITFTDGNMSISGDEADIAAYDITIDRSELVIKYTTKDNVEITLDYVAYKVIQQA